jgi:hypothetical protein
MVELQESALRREWRLTRQAEGVKQLESLPDADYQEWLACALEVVRRDFGEEVVIVPMSKPEEN